MILADVINQEQAKLFPFMIRSPEISIPVIFLSVCFPAASMCSLICARTCSRRTGSTAISICIITSVV